MAKKNRLQVYAEGFSSLKSVILTIGSLSRRIDVVNRRVEVDKVGIGGEWQLDLLT